MVAVLAVVLVMIEVAMVVATNREVTIVAVVVVALGPTTSVV